MEPLDLSEEDLIGVFDKLPLARPEEEPQARERLHEILEEFHTRQVRLVRPESCKADLVDLAELLRLVTEARQGESWDSAAEYLRSLSSRNPVLRQRLKWAFRHGGLGDPRTLETLGDHEEVISRLSREIQAEHGRGRPSEWPEHWLAHRIYEFWRRFTERGTSRYNWDWEAENDRGPFVDFLEAAGKLVDPHFNGPYFARLVHEQRDKSNRVESPAEGDAPD
jgi:hypothetical protein